MTRSLPFLLLLAACGGKATTPATTDVTNTSDAHVATPCPDAARLAEIAASAFERPHEEDVLCTALYAGEPLWLIEGHTDVTEDGMAGVSEATAIVTTGGEVRWVVVDGAIPWGAWEAEMGPGYQAADLDGDGDDEVLYFGGYSKHGYTDTYVLASDVVDGKLVPAAESVALGSDNMGAAMEESEYEGCSEEHALVAGPNGGLQLEVTRTAIGAGGCDGLGHHVYVWDGHDLKETN